MPGMQEIPPLTQSVHVLPRNWSEMVYGTPFSPGPMPTKDKLLFCIMLLTRRLGNLEVRGHFGIGHYPQFWSPNLHTPFVFWVWGPERTRLC